jgi:hypothetical protein
VVKVAVELQDYQVQQILAVAVAVLVTQAELDLLVAQVVQV